MFLGLGPSACTYYGNVDEKCNFTLIPVEDLPEECSSFIIDGCTVDSNFTISDNFGGDSSSKYFKLFT